MGKRDWIPPNLNDIQPNIWRHGLCDCCSDFCGCCRSCLCGSCVVGDIAD